MGSRSTTAPIPITILTGYLGSGKTTVLLNVVPQLRAKSPDYRLALLKNEFGDLAIDSQLAASSAISSVKELLGGCICCNLVGALDAALQELAEQPAGPPDRIVVETSGTAFPATLAMEVQRIAEKTGGRYMLDGVVSVIDVENWKGYEDVSITARIQARYTDLIILNKWEAAGERRLDEVLDKLGDMEGVDIPQIKSQKGWVDAGLLFGFDTRFGLEGEVEGECKASECGQEGHQHEHREKSHRSEFEVVDITLAGKEGQAVDGEKLMKLLTSAPKDEVLRIKAILSLASESPVPYSESVPEMPGKGGRYAINWAYGRWTCQPLSAEEHASSKGHALRMSIWLARYQSKKWMKRIQDQGFLALVGGEGNLKMEKLQ